MLCERFGVIFFHLSYRYYIIAVDRGREREKKIAFYVKKKAIVV